MPWSCVKELPFVLLSSPSSWWVVTRSGDWILDCSRGTEMARLFRSATGAKFHAALALIMRDMIRSGVWSGVEAGFLSELLRPVTHDDAHDLQINGAIVQSMRQVARTRLVCDDQTRWQELAQHQTACAPHHDRIPKPRRGNRR